ncbi:MAG: LptF/LptG family permease [Spirochaetes bacterium]|nr:LptF/LptG family permease [Spirochaetota bacterium]
MKKWNNVNLKFTIFDRYILLEFIKPYLAALFLIVIMTSITELLERMDFFLKRDVKFLEIFLYYIYKSPFLMVQFSPVAILFASVFSLGVLAKNREMMAVITGGINFFRVVLYLYIAGIVLSLFFVFFNNTVVIKAQERVRELNQKFKNVQSRYDKKDLSMYGKENYLYNITYYHYLDKKMDNVQILKTSASKDKVEFRIDAKLAQWDELKKVWIFYNGIIRYFDADGFLKSVDQFEEKEILIPETPEDFSYQTKQIDELNMIDAWKYISKLKEKGFRYQSELVDFNLKFSFAFACLLMMLIGAPLSVYSTRSVLIISFGLALLGSFIYWVLLSVGISMGKNGVLPPFLAVWIGNLFFACVSYFIHRKIAT